MQNDQWSGRADRAVASKSVFAVSSWYVKHPSDHTSPAGSTIESYKNITGEVQQAAENALM